MTGMKYSSILFIILMTTSCHNRQDYSGWTKYKGSSENIHYSSLTQIDTTNVKHLQVAWEYHTGDADTASHSQIQCNPIVVNGILYATSPKMKLFAVDAATGKEKWVFNPFDTVAGNKKKLSSLNSCRGVSYWSDGQG